MVVLPSAIPLVHPRIELSLSTRWRCSPSPISLNVPIAALRSVGYSTSRLGPFAAGVSFSDIDLSWAGVW